MFRWFRRKPVLTEPGNPQADIRRDYELALQLGTREGWNAFLAQVPGGYYANLAKGQLNKIASEEARVVATEKARIAAEESARLAAEGARQTEQAKAAALAQAAEEARVAAEKAKQVEHAKVAAAEQARVASEQPAAEKIAAMKVDAGTVAGIDRTAEESRRRQGPDGGQTPGAEAAASRVASRRDHGGQCLGCRSFDQGNQDRAQAHRLLFGTHR